MDKSIGKWAFIIGLIIAVLAGFITTYTSYVLLVLFILGLVVGFLNITEKNAVKFLVASITLIVLNVGILNALSILDVINRYLSVILGNFISFVGAAGFVVAIKSILETGKP